MTAHRTLSTIALLATASGFLTHLTACSRNDPAASEQRAADVVNVPADFQLSMSRGSCYGPCPVYEVRVDASGCVDYAGKSNVAVEGTQRWNVPSSSVAKLIAKCDELGFFDLKLRCDVVIKDTPKVIIEVTRGGITKRLASKLDRTCRSALHDDPDVHLKFDSFAAEVDEILETSSRVRLVDDGPIPADFRLTMSRSPCNGTCPVYRVSVDAAGRVEYDGKMDVATLGKETWNVPPASVETLVAKCDELGVSDLKLQCGVRVYDSPQIRIQLTRRGSTNHLVSELHEVCDSALHDDPCVHVSFATFADAVDEILETSSRVRSPLDVPLRR